MQRFYLGPENFRGDYIFSQDKKLIHQLGKVLRSKEGERFFIFDGTGDEYLAQLVTLDNQQARFLIIDKKTVSPEERGNLALYCSLIKLEKFEILLQKCTELGVSEIVPVASHHSVIKGITLPKKRRFNDIIKEATEQCGASRFMKLGDVQSFGQAIADCQKRPGLKIIAYEKERANQLGAVDSLVFKQEVQAFIGPEGGFSAEEIEAGREARFTVVGLGSRILRAETAAISVAALYYLNSYKT
ncbi:MAG: RsmE family RNA methyltransferase [Patescibacteria group bacterium]